MKLTLLKGTLVLAIACSTAMASDKGTKDKKDAKETRTATAAAKEKAKATAVPKQEVLLTGSNIKREVRKDGQVTDGPNSVAIIDQNAIQRTGVADIRQVLARQSSFR
jgi:hypothetical protein